METEILSLQFSMTFEMSLFIASRIKKPSLQKKDWVFSCATLHSPPPKTYCEAHPGGFSDLRIILLWPGSLLPSRPPCPFPSFNLPTHSRLRTVAPASFVPDYSGVAVPDFHGVPL